MLSINVLKLGLFFTPTPKINLGNGLNSLIKRTTENETVIKPADKRSTITQMSPAFYLNMCESHLRNEEYYDCIQDDDPSPLLKNKIISYSKRMKTY